MSLTLRRTIATFGSEAKAKLANVAATGEPEDQLRAPLEHLIVDLAELCGLSRTAVAAVGESSLADLKTRPDYAVTVDHALIGFIEVKAPGKGADPRRFKDRHDKQQWEKLKSLPNLIYTDGNEFSLWRSGELVGSLVRLTGYVETSGADLDVPPTLPGLFGDFITWKPIPPRDAKQLAEVSARLCRLLRDEVNEQLAIGSPALTALAADWRKLLFPEASNEQFADGYAQAVTFGLLMARAREIKRFFRSTSELAAKCSSTSRSNVVRQWPGSRRVRSTYLSLLDVVSSLLLLGTKAAKTDPSATTQDPLIRSPRFAAST